MIAFFVDQRHLIEEPGVDTSSFVNDLDADASTQRLAYLQHPVRGWKRSLGEQRFVIRELGKQTTFGLAAPEAVIAEFE